MRELEQIDQRYLFKLQKSKNVNELIYKHHCLGEWTSINDYWQTKEDDLKLQGWSNSRRVIIVRKRLSSDSVIGIETQTANQLKLAFIDGPEDISVYEYSVLVTDLAVDLNAVFHHYRDRADCENNFDEI